MLGTFQEINEDTEVVGIDIETYDPFLKQTGVSWVKHEGYILGIAVKIDNEPSQYYPIRHQTGNYDEYNVKAYINDLFKDCYDYNIPVTGHYIQYDLGWLNHYHYMNIEKCPPLFCTLIGGQLFNSEMMFSLKMMSKFFQIGEKIDIDASQLPGMLASVVERYACNDIDLTMKLYEILSTKVNDEAVARENGVLPILVMMKRNGIKVDEEKVNQLDQEFGKRIYDRMRILTQHDPKIKIWSGASIEMLFRRLHIGYPRTDKGNPSFSADFLAEVGKENPVIQALSEVRKLDRLKNGFLQGLKLSMYNGRVHSDYFNGKSEGGGTITGRLSSANPNMQQMPSRTEEGLSVRECFIPDGAAWMRGDYSQQEPRLMLHYAAKLNLPTIETWIERYKNNPDTDFYDTLMEVTGVADRFAMKTNTLALSYGMGEDHMSDIMNITKEQAREFRNMFNLAVPWLNKLNIYVQDRAIKEGKIRTLGNRYLKFSQGNTSKAFNHLIQGSAADQTKQAMIDVYRDTGKVPLSQIHDELNYDIGEDDFESGKIEVISNCMINAFQLEVPTKVDIGLGNNWREACGK